ncbi:MAG TPA: polysaccharide biosynthesis/export family protein [Hyphomicrobium sp.]|nr:polysaccharide biosynthesis/export family protein [Hyphomicrobium sp.]
MSLRLATLLIAPLLVLGGCAQDELAVVGQILPTDIIYDAPAATLGNVVKVANAGWGDTTVYRGVYDAPAAAPGNVVKVADTGWSDTTVYRGERPVMAAPPMPLWGPATVVAAPAVAIPVLPPGPHAVPDFLGPYLLDTGDRLRVFVYGQPNLSRIYTVDQIGNIAVPLIGQVHARARTTVDVERTIRAKLGTEYVKDPQVTVDVAQNRPFFILGEVRLPGQYPYVSGMTVETAVAIGGGYTERASERCFRVTRRVNGVVDVMEVPSDYTLLPGDTVYVYERIL